MELCRSASTVSDHEPAVGAPFVVNYLPSGFAGANARVLTLAEGPTVEIQQSHACYRQLEFPTCQTRLLPVQLLAPCR
jgi:hypothetical protein